MKRHIILCAALLTAAGHALSAEVTELGYALRAGFAYSDNIEQAPSGFERDATAAVAGLQLWGSRPTGRLRYDLSADLEYQEYLNLDINSELLGRAALQGSYHFVPDTVSWNARVNYDQIRADLLRPLAPGNLENQITLSTGPTLRARLSSTMVADFDGRYTRLDYSDRPFDNQTLTGRLLVGRRASARSFAGVGVAYDDVSYLSSLVPDSSDYKRKEVFAKVELQGARTGIDLEAGYADASGEIVDDSGPLFRARFTRLLTRSLTAFISGVREYPTSETAPISSISGPTDGGPIDNSLLTSAPRLTTRFEGGLRLDRARTDWEITYARLKEESLAVSGLDRNYDELRGRISRSLTPRSLAAIYGAYSSDDVSAFSGSFSERTVGAELQFSFGRSLGLELRMQHRNRDGLTAGADSSELSGGIFLRYSPDAGNRAVSR
jgi:hypothetical protein